MELGRLKRVLEVDPDKKTIVVEPGITMEELAGATLPYNLIPPVVPEFKGITIGGAICGGALESSSHLFGQFNDICLSYEIMLGDGSIIEASPESNSDLFYGIAGSYGTLGFLLSVKLRLIPGDGWIGLNFRRISSLQETLSFLARLHKDHRPPDVMEAIVFGRDDTVVIWGRRIGPGEAAAMPNISLSSYWDEWFFAKAKKKESSRVAIPLIDYLFRHDRGAFWMGGYVFHLPFLRSFILKKPLPYLMPKSPNLFLRSLFGGLFSSKNLYFLLHKNRRWIQENFVIQDFYLPEENALAFINKALARFKITPIWLCPIRSTTYPQLFSPHQREKEELLFDVGVYGKPFQASGPQAVRDLETFCYQLKGKKMLYSLNMMTQNEFWSHYPEAPYKILRKKAKVDSLIPDIVQKGLN